MRKNNIEQYSTGVYMKMNLKKPPLPPTIRDKVKNSTAWKTHNLSTRNITDSNELRRSWIIVWKKYSDTTNEIFATNNSVLGAVSKKFGSISGAICLKRISRILSNMKSPNITKFLIKLLPLDVVFIVIISMCSENLCKITKISRTSTQIVGKNAVFY